VAGGDAEQGAEGGVACAATIEAEDEFIKVGLEMPAAQAVIDAQIERTASIPEPT
jgi:hypothetical protein